MSVPSYWEHSAEPAPPLGQLDTDVQADVAVIGGGFTGLSAAHHLAKRGIAPVVLEARTPGWGSSGRNGGLVSGKFRASFAGMQKHHGVETARRMYRLGQESIDCVEELVQELAIAAAGFRRCGAVTAAYSEAALAGLAAGVSWLQRTVGDGSTVLSRAALREEVGSDRFVGGVLTPSAGCLHPLNYARGLLGSLVGRGVPVYRDSPVTAIERTGDGVVLVTPGGKVRARQAIIAANAYASEVPAPGKLHQRVIPFRSTVIATGRLPPDLVRTLLPTGRSMADSKRILRWFRVLDDRLILGGRGAFSGLESETPYKWLAANMLDVFPQLAGQPIEFRWSGYVAMTLDYLPHMGRLDDRLLYAMGYNGTGVAMTSLMGRYLARLAAGEAVDLGLMTTERFRPFPFYPLRTPGIRIVAGWHQVLDAMNR